MFQKRTVVCACGVEFTTRANNKTRCDKCQRIHHLENNKSLYLKRKLEFAALQKVKKEKLTDGEKPLRASTMLNLPCPWAEGRLPESVRRNQLWS